MPKKTSSDETDESLPQTPVIEYNNKTYESYVQNGFVHNIPHSVSAPEERKRNFLSRVDPKSKIERKVLVITRLKARDYNSKTKEKKEYLYYTEDWVGRDWVGRKLVVGDGLEGVYMEQEKEPIIKQDERSGEFKTVGYNRSGEHPVHTIEYSKTAVDKIIAILQAIKMIYYF